MKAIFFVWVRLPKLSFGRVVDAYTTWALGLDTYRRNRDRRLDLGVPAALTAAQLAQGGTFRGRHDCAISTRRAGEQAFLIRFSHRDNEDGGILWHTGVRVRSAAEGCVVEHSVARSAPRGAVLAPIAASPSVLVRLLERNGPEIEPRDLWDTGLLRLAEDDVDDFVSHILLDKDRRVPYMFITPTNEGDQYLVEPAQLAKKLAGLARVATLPTKTAAFRFTAALKRRRFANDYGVSNGSIRLFHPGLQPTQSHLQHFLWLRRRIEAISVPDRLSLISGEAASRIVERTLPIGFFDLIEHHDRTERQRAAEAVLKATLPAPPEGEHTALRQAVAERDTRIAELAQALQSAQADVTLSSELYDEEATRRRGAEDRIVELELELDEQKDVFEHRLEVKDQQLAVVVGRLEELKSQKAASAVPIEVREALEAAFLGDPSLEQCLLALVTLYPERLTVLPEAWRSARESKKFRKGAEAFRLLRKLATDYWHALQEGKGDAHARSILGDGYAAKESDTVEGNRRAREARTFMHEGQPILMLKHLKIGIKDSLSETLRVHFEWLADRKRIIVGHCGGHLPFS